MAGILDILKAAGRGVVHGENVRTRGGDYLLKDQQAENERRQLEARLAAEDIARRHGLVKLQEAEQDQASRAREAEMEGQAGVPELLAARRVAQEQRARVRAGAELGQTDAQTDLARAQAEAAGIRPQIDIDYKNAQLLNKDEDQEARADLYAAIRANIGSQIDARGAASAAKTGGDELSAESFPTWMKQAMEQAMQDPRLPADATPAQVQALANEYLQGMLASYKGIARGSKPPASPAPTPSPRAPMPPGGVPTPRPRVPVPTVGSGGGQTYQFQGQTYTWETLPEAGKAKARQKGAAPAGQ